jgi:hypothetical protein
MSIPPYSVEEVTKSEIRKAFNDGQFWERAQSGNLIAHTLKSNHLKQPRDKGPFCTRSEIVIYYTSDRTPVAWVHQYLRPNGTLGGSGRPDPKRLVIEGRIIAVRTG